MSSPPTYVRRTPGRGQRTWPLHHPSLNPTYVTSREPLSSPLIGFCFYHCSLHPPLDVFSSSNIHLRCGQSYGSTHISYPKVLRTWMHQVSGEYVPEDSRITI